MKKPTGLSGKSRLINKIAMFKANNTSAFIFVMIIITNIVSVVASSLLLLLLPENKDRTFFEMMRFAFTLMVNPSGRYQYSDYPISLIVTTVVVLIGMVSLTGGTVGYITSVINSVIKKTAQSRSKLKLENHIVILNYNHKVPSLICDYSFDDTGSTYIVILSEKNKDEIETSIANGFGSSKNRKKFKNVIVRQGNPMSKIDLDNISLDKAKTLVIMTPEEEYLNESDGFVVAKQFMFIKWYITSNGNTSQTSLIVESQDENVEKMVREYHIENSNNISIPVNINEILGKIMALIVINPLLNDAVLHLLSFEGIEIYVEDIPDSLSISDDLAVQKTAIPLLDYEFDSDSNHMGGNEGDVGKKRIYLAEDESEIFARRTEAYTLEKPLPEKTLVPNIKFEKSNIVIVGINSKLPYILESLSCFSKDNPNVDIHVILMDTKEKEEQLNKYCSDERYANIISRKPVILSDIFDPIKDIDDSIIKNMNSILFLSDDNSSSKHIDEKPLLFWNKLGKLSTGDCIVEILDMQNKDICNNEQVIVSDSFVSCLFAQLGKDPRRLDVIRDLITFKNDSISRNSNGIQTDKFNIFSINAGAFFDGYSDIPEFSSKREMMMWIYEATDKKYLPIGCIKKDENSKEKNVPFLFARTDNKSDGLDTCVFLTKEGKDARYAKQRSIKLLPDDEIIVLKFY